MSEKTLGGRIAELRRGKGYSQEYVAEQVGVSRQAVSKWEQDQSAPDTYNLIALAGLLGVTVEYLATGSTPSAPGVPEIPPPTPPAPPVRDSVASQRVVGYILLAVGLVGLLMGLFYEVLLAFAGGFMVLGGILCLAVRRHLGLVLTWVYWGLFSGLTTLMTGVVWMRFQYTVEAGSSAAPAHMSINLTGILMLVLLVWLVVNIAVTVRTLARKRRERK